MKARILALKWRTERTGIAGAVSGAGALGTARVAVSSGKGSQGEWWCTAIPRPEGIPAMNTADRHLMSVEELDERLHDAEVDLDSVSFVAASARAQIRGFLYDYTPSGRPGKFLFSLDFEDVSGVEVLDEAKVGLLPVEDIRYDPTVGVVLQGCIPVTMTVRTPSRGGFLAVGRAPIAVRKLMRWVGPGAAPDDPRTSPDPRP